MHKILAVAAVAVVLSSGVAKAAETEIRRTVSRDTESRVGSAAMWHIKGGNGRCLARGTPTLQIITPPAHGTVRFVVTDVGIPEGSGCSNSVYGVVILYQPTPGFVGQDQFTYDHERDAMGFNWVAARRPV